MAFTASHNESEILWELHPRLFENLLWNIQILRLKIFGLLFHELTIIDQGRGLDQGL